MLLKMAKKGLITPDVIRPRTSKNLKMPSVEDVDKKDQEEIEKVMQEAEQNLEASFSSASSGVFVTTDKSSKYQTQRKATDNSSKSQAVIRSLNKKPEYTPLQHSPEDLLKVK